MWMMWILAAMTALAGAYTLTQETRPQPVLAMKNVDLAGNMGVYRAAVMAYAASHPTFISGSAPAPGDSLPFPPSYQPSALWQNHVGADGMITVYADPLPPTKITTEIFDLSHRSILTGEVKAGSSTLFSPSYGDTGIALPVIPGVVIPTGSPVWMARRN